MIPRRVLLFVAGLITVLAATTGVEARSIALISLNTGAVDDLDRMLEARDLLERRHGFDEVILLEDANPAVLGAQLRTFLKQPGKKGDRRFVWISGLAEGYAGSICSSFIPETVQAKVMTLAVLPACLAQALHMPGKTYTLKRAEARPDHLAGMAKLMGGGTGTAVLTLPSHNPKAVQRADRAVLGVLGGSRGITIHPLALLDALKHAAVRADGAYRPGLVIRSWAGSFTTPTRRGQ